MPGKYQIIIDRHSFRDEIRNTVILRELFEGHEIRRADWPPEIQIRVRLTRADLSRTGLSEDEAVLRAARQLLDRVAAGSWCHHRMLPSVPDLAPLPCR